MRIPLTIAAMLLSAPASALPLDNVPPPLPRPCQTAGCMSGGGASSTSTPLQNALASARNSAARGNPVPISRNGNTIRIGQTTYSTITGRAIAGRGAAAANAQYDNVRDGTYHNGQFDD